MRLPALTRAAKLSGPRHSEGLGKDRIARQTPFKLERLCRSCRRNRRGAAAVEFAVVAPLFFLLVFGLIEFGRMVMVQQILTNASREGARVAVLDGTTESEVLDAVDAYMVTASVQGVQRDLIAIDDETGEEKDFTLADYGDAIRVSVSVPFDQVSWLPSPMFLGGNTLSATTVMRRETVQ